MVTLRELLMQSWVYLELHTNLYFLLEHLSDDSIKGSDNLHSELRFDSLLVNEVIEGIDERQSDAGRCRSVHIRLGS